MYCEGGKITEITKYDNGTALSTTLALFVTSDGGLIQTDDGTYELTVSDEDDKDERVSLKLLDSVNKKVNDFAGSESGKTQFALPGASSPD